MSIEVEILKAEVDRLVKQSPKITNAEMNRGFTGSANEFYRVFTRERLSGKGGIRVRRKVVGGALKRGGVRVPARARAMGFGGFLLKRDILDGKTVVMRNTNPIALAHEQGAVITPKKGKHLFIPVKNLSAARRAGVKIGRGKRPKVIRVDAVRLKQRLKFILTWERFVPKVIDRLGKSLNRAKERIEAAARRGGRR